MAGMIGGITQTAMGTVGGIFSAIAGIKADKQLSKLIKEDPKYTSSPYAQNTLGLAQTLLNGRMAGASAKERNLYGSQANQISNINRNATDSSQALALAAGAQGQTNAGFDNLQMQEGQDYNNKLNNLNQANQGMTAEHKDLFDDSVRRWQDQVNTVMTQYKMRQKGGNDVGQWGAGLSSMGGGGGMGGGGMSGGGGMGGSSVGAGGGGMSDKRLKHNYYIVGKSKSGINIYEFSYHGSNVRYQGVMADEVKEASFMTDSGFYAVDYSKIDVQFKQV